MRATLSLLLIGPYSASGIWFSPSAPLTAGKVGSQPGFPRYGKSGANMLVTPELILWPTEDCSNVYGHLHAATNWVLPRDESRRETHSPGGTAPRPENYRWPRRDLSVRSRRGNVDCLE